MVASACPAVTVAPRFAATDVTVPLWANLTLAWLAGSMAPVADTVCFSVDVTAATSCVAAGAAAAWSRVYSHAAVVAAMRTARLTITTITRRARPRLRRRGADPAGPAGVLVVSSETEPSAWSMSLTDLVAWWNLPRTVGMRSMSFLWDLQVIPEKYLDVTWEDFTPTPSPALDAMEPNGLPGKGLPRIAEG
jgi:hypothetical protein